MYPTMWPGNAQFHEELRQALLPSLRWSEEIQRATLPTLPDRAAHARQAKLSPLEFLELLLQDEIDRRNSRGLQLRLAVAGFEEEVTPETITWDSPVSYDRPRVRDLFGLHWLAQQENVIFTGPVGVGKSFFAQALGRSPRAVAASGTTTPP